LWRLLAVLGVGLALLPTTGQAEPLQIPDTPPPPAQAPVRHADPLTLDSPITGPSYLTAHDVDRFLATFPLHGYGAAFIEQEARTRVRADFMVGIVMVENTLGKSGLAQEQHNLFSIKGSGASGFEEYATWEDSIRRGADYLSGNYVRPGQPLYRGGRVRDIAQVYAESGTWPQRVIDTANLIGPSASPAYEAAVRIDSVAGGQVRFRIANRGYMPWRQAGPEHFLVHAFWTGQRRSESAVVRVEARDLTSGGSTEYDLELGSTLPDAWRLVVTVELAGADWLIGLGSEATAVWLPEPTQRGTNRPGISAG
jgi:hypothetical protein